MDSALFEYMEVSDAEIFEKERDEAAKAERKRAELKMRDPMMVIYLKFSHSTDSNYWKWKLQTEVNITMVDPAHTIVEKHLESLDLTWR